MFFSGIADEAGRDIDTQIRAHQTLGWNHIELRMINEFNLATLPENQYREVFNQLQAAGLQVSCFASAIANWAKKISGDFMADLNELKNAIPRLHELGTRLVRIMSYPNDNWSDLAWFNEVVRRLKELTKVAVDNDLILVHENCSGWGGRGPEHTLQLLEAVDSPTLKLLFDTGNPPAEGQDGWDFYSQIKNFIVYVHIKDALGEKKNGQTVFTFPGEGDGFVAEIVKDLLAAGYEGGFSIEPHLAAIIHLDQQADQPEAAFNAYVEYGRRLMELVKSCQESR